MNLAFQLKVKWFHMSYVKAPRPILDLAILDLKINAMTTNPKPIRGQEGSPILEQAIDRIDCASMGMGEV